MATEKTRYKIPPDAEAGIYARAGEGKTLAEICNWLEQTHGVRVSPTAIRKKLAKRRAEREVVAKAVVREQLSKTVLSDIDVLDVEKGRLRKLARRLFRTLTAPVPKGLDEVQQLLIRAALSDTGELYLKTVDRLTKVVHTKLHYSGADAPDDPLVALADAERRLTGRLDRLAAKRREDEAPPGDRSDSGG